MRKSETKLCTTGFIGLQTNAVQKDFVWTEIKIKLYILLELVLVLLYHY